ncbi:hypothetical protein ACNS7O_03225 [Haloferacaceae archaeon DSL9]
MSIQPLTPQSPARTTNIRRAWRRRSTFRFVAGALCALAGLAVLGGPLGAALGLVAVGASLATGVAVGVALLHLALLAAVPPATLSLSDPLFLLSGAPALAAFAAFELGCCGVLLSDGDDDRAVAAFTLLGAGAFAGVFVALLSTTALWIAASLVFVLAGALAYGVHRYELVALGLVEPDSDDDTADRHAHRPHPAADSREPTDSTETAE